MRLWFWWTGSPSGATITDPYLTDDEFFSATHSAVFAVATHDDIFLEATVSPIFVKA